MLPDRVLNPGPLTYESGALPIVLHGPAHTVILTSEPVAFWTLHVLTLRNLQARNEGSSLVTQNLLHVLTLRNLQARNEGSSLVTQILCNQARAFISSL